MKISTTDDAVISTAWVTWWLVWITLIAALATLFAVVGAFLVQVRQFGHDGREETRRIRATARRAVLAISEAIEFLKRTELSRRNSPKFNAAEVWPMIGEAEVHLRVVQWHMGQRIEDNCITWCGQSAIQRLYEARSALNVLVRDTLNRPTADRLVDSNRTLRHSIERLKSIEEPLSGLTDVYPGPAS